ncbi:TetR/AcrR family transcriptional regulator [Labrenzia sp. PHM005]|uniref:TetR/AcrR family transcriptional regulator n=1 Tax=Labrenzia sp. PHM005 TaxID=2590016 RepID=UPI00114036BA|nr:TetR/AcrR family transcriptional regulator [Labrenzia sp. PHM005]QDG75213.1 TetR/AcrR family transcriptional regulator [Labrenzia sp. PHM005]
MREENRLRRQAQIEQAAYEVLEKKGYAGTSVQGIARAARASNETLYKWYGDKKGLFKALVERNTEDVKALLETDLSSNTSAFQTLEHLGPRLLNLVLGDRAVALNRAAVADASGDLSEAIALSGREVVFPLIAKVLEDGREKGELIYDSSDEAAALYINLLIGDLQIRRVIGRLAAPTEDFCNERSERALKYLQRLLKA